MARSIRHSAPAVWSQRSRPNSTDRSSELTTHGRNLLEIMWELIDQAMDVLLDPEKNSGDKEVGYALGLATMLATFLNPYGPRRGRDPRRSPAKMGSTPVKVYIAGPIFGKPGRNLSLFRKVADQVMSQLLAIPVVPEDIKPAPHAGPCPPGRRSEGEMHNASCHLRADIAELVTCDAVALLPGWVDSLGARLEMDVASNCGLLLYRYDEKTERLEVMR